MHTPIPFPTARPAAGTDLRETATTFLYENLSAALWAAETLAGLSRESTGRADPRLSSWNFPSLENPLRHAQATAHALRSNLIVIALSSANRVLPVSVKSWLENCLTQRRGTKATVAALFVSSGPPDGADSPALRSLQRVTSRAGCELIVSPTQESTLSVA